MELDEINRIRIAAFKKHGPCRIIRLRDYAHQLQFYVCQMRLDDPTSILTVLAGGTTEAEIMRQL